MKHTTTFSFEGDQIGLQAAARNWLAAFVVEMSDDNGFGFLATDDGREIFVEGNYSDFFVRNYESKTIDYLSSRPFDGEMHQLSTLEYIPSCSLLDEKNFVDAVNAFINGRDPAVVDGLVWVRADDIPEEIWEAHLP